MKYRYTFLFFLVLGCLNTFSIFYNIFVGNWFALIFNLVGCIASFGSAWLYSDRK